MLLKRCWICGLLVLILPLIECRSLVSQDPVDAIVFQIGQFDRSSAEFASGSPKQRVEFVVSKSDTAKDWFRVQPAAVGSGFRPGETGVGSAPRAVTFLLESSPAKSYRLHVGVLLETASVPVLQICINGLRGIFYLHALLDYSGGEQRGSFDPVYSSADVEFTFPGSFLREGDNTITFQAIEQSADAVPDAGITYDAIELVRDMKKTDSNVISGQIEPTIFFKIKDGKLFENVEAFIRSTQPLKSGSAVELTIKNREYHSKLRGGNDFGEEKVEFQVLGFKSRTRARLTLEIGGEEQIFDQSIAPAKEWTLYIVPHIHLDVGYSDYQAKVAAIQSRTIDEAMRMTRQNPDFRFSLDGEWDLQQFLETRSAAERQKAIKAIQANQLFVPAQYANLLTGIASTETLIRSLYPSANFSRKYGTRLDYANITDVPSWSWSYASVLASAGIPYLLGGSNNYRAPVLIEGRLHEDSPMWWMGPDGQKVLLWYSRHYEQTEMLFGSPPIMSAGHDTLPLFLQMYSHANYRANAAIIYGTQVENTDLFPQQAELARKWNSNYAYPHLRYSGFHDALADLEQQFGSSIPTIRGDGGPYWEDGAAADAYYLAMDRWSEARALTAEKFATLTSFVNPQLETDTAGLERMWTDLVLMDEHTWDSYDSVSDPTSDEATEQRRVKEQFAINAQAEADFIVRRSMADLANAIPIGPGGLIVFNSLNWKRSGTVLIDLKKGNEIVDALTKQATSFEILRSGKVVDHVRFLAQNVPALGYKVYMMRPAEKSGLPTTDGQSAMIESKYYKVLLDPKSGAILSIYDKQLQRELVNQNSPYRFGQYLYVTGGDVSPSTILTYTRVASQPTLQIYPGRSGRLLSIKSTPLGQVASMQCEDVNTPSIKTEIRLSNQEKKIEIVEDVNKEEVGRKEAVYFAFPFAMSQPRFQYEIQNGVVDPAKDMYPGAGHEWFSVQHWVSVEQDGVSGTVMPLDAPLVTLGDINRGLWPQTFGYRPGTIFSYVMNNYWDTNYRASQGGNFQFHYIVTSAASANAADLSRMGWEASTPLELDIITPQDKASSFPTHESSDGRIQLSENLVTASSPQSFSMVQRSFLDVSDPNVLLETWKPAEDGDGTILRFLDFGGTERTVTVRVPLLHLQHVWRTDAVERGHKEISMDAANEFHFTIHPHEIITMRLIVGSPEH